MTIPPRTITLLGKRHSSPPGAFEQNDGSLDGYRYFLCHPNRGLFVRITRCRTCIGHNVKDARHVSFSGRTLGEKAGIGDWSSKPLNQIRPNTVDAYTVRSASEPPYLSDIARWNSASVGSSGSCRPRRKQHRADAQLNTTKWAPADTSGSGRRETRRYDSGARRTDTRHNNIAPDSTSSGSSTSSETDPLEVKLGSGLSRSWSSLLPHGQSVPSFVT